MCPLRRTATLASMEMNRKVTQRPWDQIRFGAVPWARRLLWTQVMLLAGMWLFPNAMVAALVATKGIPHDGSAGWLLIPVIFSMPLLLLGASGAALAAQCLPGRRGVHAGIIVWETGLLTVGGLGNFVPPLKLIVLLGAIPPAFAIEMLAGVGVLAILIRVVSQK